MTENELNEIKESLVRLEQELLQEIESAKINSQPVVLDQQSVGRLSRIDAIQQQEMHISSLRRLQQRLALVKKAFERLTTGDFGFCINCEEPLTFKRLKARPESPVCTACAGKAK